MSLQPHHLEQLRASGLTDAVIEARGYWSCSSKTELRGKGFASSQVHTISAEKPALMLPVYRAGVAEPVYHQMRPDSPRNREGKDLKYETPKGAKPVVDVPPPARDWIGDPQRALYITEGSKKADAGVSHGLCTVALLGVYGFRGTNNFGGRTALGDWESFALNSERPVYIVYDSDVSLKKDVHHAMVRLKGLLEARGAANVRFVYLEPGQNGEKVGLDDFLVRCKKGQAQYELHLRSQPDPKPFPRDEEDDAADPDAHERRQYQYSAGGTWWYKDSQRIRLANGHWRILEDVVQDDGTEERVRVYQLEGYVDLNGNSRHPKRFTVKAEKFDTMDWVREHFGASAILSPGAGTKERLRHAIQLLSGEIEERTAYTHLGWRKIEDEWVYLHADGAIGPHGAVEGIRAEVATMSRYALPEPPEGEELREAVRRSLAFLDLSDRSQTWPLLAGMYTAPLADFLPTDFVLWIQGETGSRKSSAAKLALNHFGTFERTAPFPANFDSTANAVEYSLFLAKDAPNVIDDYNPANNAKDQQKQDAVAHRILSAVGDRRTRQRMNSDAEVKSGKLPRCLAIVTAELDPPGAQSRIARAFVTDWTRSAVRLDRLTRAQQDDAPYYSQAMAGYLRFLAPQIDRLRKSLPQSVRKEAERMPPSHGRIQEAGAKLYIGVAGFLQFAVSVGAINAAQQRELLSEAWNTFAHYAERTGAAQAERKPALLFVEYLRAMLVKGQVFVADRKSGLCPEGEPGRWGYQPPRGNESEPQPRSGAAKIGWVDLDKGEVCLDSTVAHELITGYSQKAGVFLVGTKRSMGEALDREQLLVRKYPDRWEANVWAEGGKHWCWVLSVNILPGASEDDEDGPFSPPDAGAFSPNEEAGKNGARTHPEISRGDVISGGTGGTGGNGLSQPAAVSKACVTVGNHGTDSLLQNLLQNESILEEKSSGPQGGEGFSSRTPSRTDGSPEEQPGVGSLTVTHPLTPTAGQNGATPPLLQNAAHPPLLSAERARVVSAAELPALIEQLAAAPVVGIDTETTGLNPRRDRVRLLTLSVPGKTWLVDCFEVDPRPLFPVLQDRTLTGHYLQFDLGMLWELGFRPGRAECTMLLAQLLSASGTETRKGWHSLAQVAQRTLGIELPKEQQKSNWAGRLSQEQWDYAARDAEILLPLREAQRAEIDAAGMAMSADIESRSLPAIAWMSAAGISFAAEPWAQLAAEAQAEVVQLRAELDAIAPEAPEQRSFGTTWNWDSNDIVKRVLKILGFELRSVGDEVLATLDHPVADLLRRYRKATRRVSSYGATWLELVENGRIYPHWKQLGSRAGRMSCEDPNPQQMPRDKRYRACIQAAPGRVLVKADYSQIELRIAAKVAADKRLLQAYAEGTDVHTLTASTLLGRPFRDDAEKKEARQLAKAVNFGLLYGMGADTLRGYARNSYGVELTDVQAAAHRRKWLRLYRGISAWHRSQTEGAVETRTLAGRRRKDVSWFTQKLNSPVQGTGADGLKRALALLWERRHLCPGAVPVIACHDEIVVECDAEQAPVVEAWLRLAMLDGMAPLVHPVPVEIETQIGPSWGG